MVHPSFASVISDSLPNTPEAPEIPSEISVPDNPACQQLVRGVLAYSPYLSELLGKYPETLAAFFAQGADASFDALQQTNPLISDNEAELMKQMRHYKHRAALLIALADIAGLWNLRQITAALSEVAERCLNASLDFLLSHYQQHRGLHIEAPENGSGVMVLAMGKLGAYELNYSSDVDLILLYDAEKLSHARGRPLPQLLNRFAQDYIRLMQERTGDGYVFRMDLRLRPDPASTPLMIPTGSAMRYYESVGQNWERAAYIKARPIAGDKEAGHRFLHELRPFIWRKSLDFAALADIQSIKRQMDRQMKQDEIEIAGFNVKKGIGGIREIEFLAQTHQLIWGGRRPELRTASTLDTYGQLQQMGLMSEQDVTLLRRHYERLRQIEHRLQMRRDEQTHKIPENETNREQAALFCGAASRQAFEQDVATLAKEVHQLYHESMEDDPSLAGEGKLSFIGVTHDEDTLSTLSAMGFGDAEFVSQQIQAWHRGSIPAMRSARARELLTEITPGLLEHIAEQTDADATFRRFARFFSQLPAGVTFLSLLSNRPHLLDILTLIIGNAPQMATYLAQHPDWLDALLTFSKDAPTLNRETLMAPLHYRMQSHQPEEVSRWLCRYRCEHEFVLGCQLLVGEIDPLALMPLLTQLADSALQELCRHVTAQFEEKYGRIEGSSFAIVALGKLASREMTFGSDLDLLFLYDVAEETLTSDGARPLGVSTYYNRLAQRIVGQLTAPTPEGRLYEVDSRLRPAGADGPLAVNLRALQHYYQHDAWTFERMALSRYRIVVTSPDQHIARFEPTIETILNTPQTPESLIEDAREMRARIWKQYPATTPWKIKHAQGGLIDLAFIAQVLGLQHPEIRCANPSEAIFNAQQAGIVSAECAEHYIHSLQFQTRLQTLLRLCHSNMSEKGFSAGLRKRMATALALKDFHRVKESLHAHQQNSYNLFKQLIGDYV